MINLSVNAINQRAPYKVEQTGDDSFLFETKQGVVYSVGFLQDISFYGEGVYQFYLINMSGRTIRTDENISETVRVIIEEFFSHKEAVMLYICDTSDGRQIYRDRLFRIWFNTYIQNDSYSLLTESILIDNIRYYSSVLMRKDNPKLVQVLSSFTNFFKEHNEE